MPSRHYYAPPYSNLIGRATLCALLLAGGSGIAWDVFTMPQSEMSGINQQLVAANDTLATRAVTTRAVIRQDSAAVVALAPSDAAKDTGKDASAETTVVFGSEKSLATVTID